METVSIHGLYIQNGVVHCGASHYVNSVRVYIVLLPRLFFFMMGYIREPTKPFAKKWFNSEHNTFRGSCDDSPSSFTSVIKYFPDFWMELVA